MSTRTALLVLVAAGALAVGISGCAPVVESPTSSPVAGSPSENSGAPTPSATPSATVDPSILFTLTATAIASGANNATVDLSETVYAPAATTSDLAGDTAILNKQCSGWQKQTPNHLFLVAVATSTLRAGSPTWPKGVTPVAVSIDGLGDTAWSGDYSPFEAECASPLMNFPGKIRGVEVLPAGVSPDAKNGWASTRYGFGAAVDGPTSSIPKKDRITINNCAITLGPTAQADPVASAWAAAVAKQKYAGEACFVGAID